MLIPGLPPEPVLVEALTQAEVASVRLEIIILRRAAGFTTDAALLATVEHAADEDHHALRARLPLLLPAYALTDGVPHVLRTTRGSGGPTDKPSRTLTTPVLRVAHQCGVSVVVAPHGLLRLLDPALTGISILTVPTEQPPGTTTAQSSESLWPTDTPQSDDDRGRGPVAMRSSHHAGSSGWPRVGRAPVASRDGGLRRRSLATYDGRRKDRGMAGPRTVLSGRSAVRRLR